MKVLYWGLDYSLGGIETFAKNMYDAIDLNKIQIDFLSVCDMIYYEHEFKAKGSTIYRITARRTNPFIFYYELIKFFYHHHEYKVVHLHLASCSCIAPAVVASFFGRKVIVHSHNNNNTSNYIKKILYFFNKIILNHLLNYRIACSNLAGKNMFGTKAFDIINNGINVDQYIFDKNVREQYRKEFGIENKFVIGHVGRFIRLKNHNFIVNIFKKIYSQNKDVVLLLVGDGETYSEILYRVKESGLTDSVIFTGVREDVNSIMQAMDVFLFPSIYEGLGIALIEAQASGLRCIASSNIPSEAIITELVDKISLNDSINVWIKSILKYKNGYKRKSQREEIINMGFDNTASAKKLEELYLKLDL